MYANNRYLHKIFTIIFVHLYSSASKQSKPATTSNTKIFFVPITVLLQLMVNSWYNKNAVSNGRVI